MPLVLTPRSSPPVLNLALDPRINLQRVIKHLHELAEPSLRILRIEYLSAGNHPAMPRVVCLAGVFSAPLLQCGFQHLDLAAGHAVVVGGVAEVETGFDAGQQAMGAGIVVLVESAAVE